MRNELQRFRRKLKAIGAIAFNILQLISALLAIITTSLGAAFLAWFFHLQYLMLPIITFIGGIFLTLILLILFVWKSTPPRWLLRGYRHITWESLYQIHKDDPQHHTFTIKVLIEAIQPGIDVFEDTYQWTGQGKEEAPEVISSGHTLMGPTVQRSGWNYYYIHLGRDINIGERVEIKTKQELYDHENQFQPFLAKIISQPVDNLILRVQLPLQNLPSNINFTEYSAVGPASTIVKNSLGQIDHHTGEIHWEISSPIFGHRYEISWHQ